LPASGKKRIAGTYKILKDPEQKVFQLYGGVSLPTTLIVNREGNIVKRIQSYFKGEEVILDSIVSELLQQPTKNSTFSSEKDSSGFFNNISLNGSNYLRANSGSEGRYDNNANWYEDWFDLRIGSPSVSYKMRFRSYQFVQDLDGSHENVIRNSNHRIVKQLLKFENKFTDIQAGNIYTNIGRGLAFRTYEDRNARIDKDLKGAKISVKGSPVLLSGKGSLGLLGGNVFGSFKDLNEHDAFEDSTRDTHVQGVFGSYSPVKNFTLGFHGIEAFKIISNAKLVGGNTELTLNNINLYTSYIQGVGEDKSDYPKDYTSRATYTGLTSQVGSLDLSLEYKYYFNYAFDFTDPPNLLKYHTFRLLARNLLFSNNQREEGVQAKLNYKLPKDVLTSTNVSYIVSSYERSNFYVHHVDLPFLDVNQDVEFNLGPNTKLLLNLNFNDKKTFPEGHFEIQQAYTFASELERTLNKNYSMQFVFELQHVNLDIMDLVPAIPDSQILGSEGELVDEHAYQQSAFYLTLAKIGQWSITGDYELTNFYLEDDSKTIHHSLPGVANGWIVGWSAQSPSNMFRRQLSGRTRF